MIRVMINEVPAFLRCGKLYESFVSNFDEEEQEQDFLVPTRFFKLDDRLVDENDLIHMLNCLRF